MGMKQKKLFGNEHINAPAVQTQHDEPVYKPQRRRVAKAAYQEALYSLEVMQDRSARKGHGHRIKLDVLNRGECEGRKLERAAGTESCPFYNCQHHLVGEAMRIHDKEVAADVQFARWEGRIKHTCSLDFAELDEGDDDKAADLMGINRSVYAQRVAEAAFKMRELIELEFASEDAFAGFINEENEDELD